MKTVAIIQARMTSERLPGKVMMDICGKPMIAHVIERAQQMKTVDQVVLAVPNGDISQPLLAVGIKYGLLCISGSEKNVLQRYFFAATQSNADVVVRITGDCPLLDPEVSDKVVMLRKRENADYASNVHPRSWPKGLDTEAFTYEALVKAYRNTSEEYDLEHVTPYIIRNSVRVNLPSGRFDLADINWSVDTKKDLERVRSMIQGKIAA